MNFNSSNYFAYKKSRIKPKVEVQNKTISKLNFLFQLFVVTFIIMFIIIAVSIMKYSSKIDIEYSKAETAFNEIGEVKNTPSYSMFDEDVERKIDKRLHLIQQEENAPSEARVVNKPKQNASVIDSVHILKNKKILKTEKQIEIENKPAKHNIFFEEAVKAPAKAEAVDFIPEKNVSTLSKILVGRYSTFEDAQNAQNSIKAKDASLSPFVRKVGDAYSVQMGSYQDFEIAKVQAQILKSKGFDVWIYQQ